MDLHTTGKSPSPGKWLVLQTEILVEGGSSGFQITITELVPAQILRAFIARLRHSTTLAEEVKFVEALEQAEWEFGVKPEEWTTPDNRETV